MGKGFVDILFILLCSTIVMLSQSLQIGSVEISPAKVGGGGISEVKADEIQLVVITEKGLNVVKTDGSGSQSVSTVAEMTNLLTADNCVLLTVENEKISHQKVMQVWSECQKAGWQVKLGAQEEDKTDQPEGKD